MSVFADTSALFAVLAAKDPFHVRAGAEWVQLIDEREKLVSSNYVLLEITALLQSRIGLDAVRAFDNNILPVLEIVWIDQQTHERAVASLIGANRRQLSLVDMTSFSVMRERRIDTAFTFDIHFSEQGFSVVPG